MSLLHCYINYSCGLKLYVITYEKLWLVLDSVLYFRWCLWGSSLLCLHMPETTLCPPSTTGESAISLLCNPIQAESHKEWFQNVVQKLFHTFNICFTTQSASINIWFSFGLLLLTRASWEKKWFSKNTTSRFKNLRIELMYID